MTLWHKKTSRGFTLIELLVVIAIIGALASVVMAGVNSARAKARDAWRISTVKNIQNALELYRNANGGYPNREEATASINSGGAFSFNPAWLGLYFDLLPYIKLPITDVMKGFPNPSSGSILIYVYDSDSTTLSATYGSNKTYGLAFKTEKDISDGGYYPNTTDANVYYYEVGEQPKYCMNAYSGENRRWWLNNIMTTICSGGD